MNHQASRYDQFSCFAILWCCIFILVFFFFISCKSSSDSRLRDKGKEQSAISIPIRSKVFARPPITLLTEKVPEVTKASSPFITSIEQNQGTPFFTHFGAEQGLALNSVLCSATDRAGNIWFGTAGGGVSRYDGKSFLNYTIANGLSGNVVFSILEDKKNNLWFGTTSGVSLYDGYHFTKYSVADGLAGNYISCIAEDKQGNLWFGSHEGGVSKFDGKKFINYTKTQGLPDNYIKCILSDRDGSIWFGTASRGVSNFDGIRFKNYDKENGLILNNVNAIFQDKAGNVWFCTSAGLSRLNQSHFTNFSIKEGMRDNTVNCMTEDESGNLWLGSQSGILMKFDGKAFVNYTRIEQLENYNLTSVIKDKGGNLWFTSFGNGISKFSDNKVLDYSLPHNLKANLVFSIIKDKAGYFWLGTQDGGVIKIVGNRVLSWTASLGLADDWAWNIFQDKSGNFWIGTDKSGLIKYDGKNFFRFTTKQGLAGNSVSVTKEDRNGNLWVGTINGVSKFDGKSITTYTTAQGLAGNNVQSISEDRFGNIWFGTHDDGISKFDGSQFTNYSTAQGLPSNTVYASITDKYGNLWFGTNKGASKYDGHRFTNYTSSKGLPDDNVWVIAEDRERDILWFGTNAGVGMMNESPLSTGNSREIKADVFNEKTGYPIREVNAGALFVDKDGSVWIGSSHNELIRFDYPSVKKKKERFLNLQIQNIKVNNEDICWNNLLRNQKYSKPADSLSVLNEMITTFGKVLSPEILDSMAARYRHIRFEGLARFYPVPDGLVLPYNENSITIDFAAIAPANYRQISYQFKLENYSRNWSSPGINTSVDFGNLPPGDYTFRVKAFGPFDVVSETEYNFTVLSPWWATWWAFILYGLIAIGVFIFFYRNHIRSIKHKQFNQIKFMVATQEEERRRIARDLHDDIGIKLSAMKLNLSSLSEKILHTNDREIGMLTQRTEDLVGEAVQDVRRLLRNLSPGVLEEFGYVTAIESLVNKINETGKTHFNLILFGMEKRLPKEYELALFRMTQELINNIIKHADAKQASLQIGQRDKKIVLTIEDDGKGFEIKKENSGHGLHNLTIRTKVLKGSIRIESKPGAGTSILIEIPYNKTFV